MYHIKFINQMEINLDESLGNIFLKTYGVYNNLV